jgi:hypothetical protein
MDSPQDEIGLDVALAVIQGMTDMSNGIANQLIDSLQHDAHRYRILCAAIEDYAEEVDSRRISRALNGIVADVHDLGSEDAKRIADNAQLWSYPRVNFRTTNNF